MSPEPITLQAVSAAEAQELAELRVEAMRESLENVGRFDPERARSRFLSTFSAANTRRIVLGHTNVGVVVVRQDGAMRVLDHLYVHPAHQGRGIGSAVLLMLMSEARSRAQGMLVGALKQSRSNAFYVRHGFKPVADGDWDHYYVWHPQGDA